MNAFRDKVINFVKRIPRGRVVSYGQVAAACGSPRAARQVGAILRGLDIASNWGPQISEQVILKGNLGKEAKLRRPKQTKNLLLAEAAGASDPPWWRVLNNKGIISIKGNWTATKELQKILLLKEGVKVSPDFTLNMEKYRWKI